MRSMLSFFMLCLSSFGVYSADDAQPQFGPAELAFYEAEVKPLLKAHCTRCHGDDPKKVRAGLNLTARAGLLRGGDTGPAYDAKTPAESLLLKAVRYNNDDEAYNMPPTGKLPDESIAILTKWINLGAPYPPSEQADLQEETKPRGADPNYWAFKPVVRPIVPTVRDQAWVKTPIDAFILAKLEEKELTPTVPAEKAALARRLYYNLIGLPPTPEQLDTYLKDTSANAYEKLVDQLLASPHYGEKWGRHWLDVVRYAETNGYERDSAKPYAFRYRDYVIRSFNEDKPYDRFLTEQVAGDELAAKLQGTEQADAYIAAGFYRLGTWDDEPADKSLAMYDTFDDYITTVGQGMLGLTLNCARCHDHKGDFFPQDDYYRFLAFFRGITPYGDPRYMLVDISPEEQRNQYERELNARKEQIRNLQEQMKPIEDAAILKMDPKDQLAVQDGKRAEIVRKVSLFLEGEEKTKYVALRKQLKELEDKPSPPQTLALSVARANKNPPPTHTLIRGNPGAVGKLVTPGFPEVFAQPEPDVSQGRRTALATWITSPTNPMTARVMVNRIWQGHFGRGIVPTANDFGKLGELPSHPELLDWLASEFIEQGWSIKRIHKLILMSQTYQLATTPTDPGHPADPANVLRRYFTPRRLTAEEVRDSFLYASGQLNLTLFGESVFPKIPREVLAGQSRPGEGWHFNAKRPELANRRSVYVHRKRNLQVPILATHDQADADTTCPVRYTTTVPTQALGLLNGEFSNEQAMAFAARLEREHPGDVRAQIQRAIRLTTGRNATVDEVKEDEEFITRMQAEHKLDRSTALARYALLLLNTNEFLYLD